MLTYISSYQSILDYAATLFLSHTEIIRNATVAQDLLALGLEDATVTYGKGHTVRNNHVKYLVRICQGNPQLAERR